MLYRCYAKINLTLEILGKRPDGFHELASVVHTISLADELRVEPAHELLTRVEGLDIQPEANLVIRAANLLQQRLDQRAGADVSLVKRIPVASGLGGGSSDAASTLVALNGLWGRRLGFLQLAELASALGADVPFFLRGGAALMRGRGDLLEALPAWIEQWLVLLVTPHDVLDKTRRLYAALSAKDFTAGELTARAAQRLSRGELLNANDCANAFERPARQVFPGLSRTWKDAERICERSFHLSGAGPALFAFASDRRDALAQTKRLGAGAYAVRTVKHARASTNVIRYA